VHYHRRTQRERTTTSPQHPQYTSVCLHPAPSITAKQHSNSDQPGYAEFRRVAVVCASQLRRGYRLCDYEMHTLQLVEPPGEAAYAVLLLACALNLGEDALAGLATTVRNPRSSSALRKARAEGAGNRLIALIVRLQVLVLTSTLRFPTAPIPDRARHSHAAESHHTFSDPPPRSSERPLKSQRLRHTPGGLHLWRTLQLPDGEPTLLNTLQMKTSRPTPPEHMASKGVLTTNEEAGALLRGVRPNPNLGPKLGLPQPR
jgi:hypothetical protein